MQWPLRILLVIGGLVLATPGGSILPPSNMQMELLALAILVPAVVLAVLFTRGRFARG